MKRYSCVACGEETREGIILCRSCALDIEASRDNWSHFSQAWLPPPREHKRRF